MQYRVGGAQERLTERPARVSFDEIDEDVAESDDRQQPEDRDRANDDERTPNAGLASGRSCGITHDARRTSPSADAIGCGSRSRPERRRNAARSVDAVCHGAPFPVPWETNQSAPGTNQIARSRGLRSARARGAGRTSGARPRAHHDHGDHGATQRTACRRRDGRKTAPARRSRPRQATTRAPDGLGRVRRPPRGPGACIPARPGSAAGCRGCPGTRGDPRSRWSPRARPSRQRRRRQRPAAALARPRDCEPDESGQATIFAATVRPPAIDGQRDRSRYRQHTAARERGSAASRSPSARR